MSKAFQVLQLGREVTPGTNVPATTVFRGPGANFIDSRGIVFKDENIAIVGGVNETYTPRVLAEFETIETEVSFEQTPHIMEASIATATPAADGVGSGKIYDYPLHDTVDPLYTVLKTYSAEFGDPGAQYEEASYCVCSEWELTAKAEEAWKFTSKWFGREVTNTTKTAALTAPTINYAKFQKTKMYLDAVSGNFGSTQVAAGTLQEVSVKCVTGWYPYFSAEGELYFTKPLFDSSRYSIILEMTLLLESVAVAQRDLWRLETPRLLQLKTEGSALVTPGTTYTYRTMIQNYAGKWSKFDPISSANGTSLVKGTFINAYDSTEANRGNILFVNELAALP